MQHKKPVSYLIDFDSTFIKSEGLDELAAISLAEHPQKEERVKRIRELTNLGMEGKVSFEDSLKERIRLLQTDKNKITSTAGVLQERVTESFLNNKTFFSKHKNHIYVISGGFKELILPVVKKFGISEDHVYANTFMYDQSGNVTGIDESNFMSQNQGKVKVVKSLKLSQDLYIIGDGYTDYELKKLGLAEKFIAFTENVSRLSVIENADEIAHTFDEFLFENKLPRTFSYPKNRIQVLLQGRVPKSEQDIFIKEGYTILSHENELSNKHPLIVCTYDVGVQEVESILLKTKVLACGINTGNIKHVQTLCRKKGIALFQKHIAKRIVSYINTGNTAGCLSLPSLSLRQFKASHRLLHIHQNVPRVLAQINVIMAKRGLNILGQYLRTNDEIGYVITDINATYDRAVLKDLKQIESTIRLRVLY